MPFPEEGLVYDYKLEDGGASLTSKDDDEDEESKTKINKVIHTVHSFNEIKRCVHA